MNKYKMTLKAGFALTVSSLISFAASEAGTRSYSDVTTTSYSSSKSQITTPGHGPTERNVTIPFNKSSYIELPNDIMDVIIANREIAEPLIHSSRKIVMFGRSPGQTNARFMDHNGEEMLSLNIRVERDLTGLKSLLSEHGGTTGVGVKAVNNNLLLTGDVPNAASAARIEKLAALWLDETTSGNVGEVVNLMNIQARDQVMLKVRIVEMQRSVTKQLGFNLGVVGEIGGASVSLLSNNALSTAAGFSGGLQYNNSDAGGTIQQLTSSLQALEQVGLVRTVAEPTLTSVSGESASFQAGGEFAVLSGTGTVDPATGTITNSFEFKEFGVSVGFTPVVLDEGRISMNLETGISELTTVGSFTTASGTVPGLRTRRASSVVEVPTGSSIVIAGLIQQENRTTADGTPGVKDIPGLGAFFRNRDEVNTETELVIIATPYLVDGTHPDNLQTPVDGFVPPSDSESLILGRLNKTYKRDANKPSVQGSRHGTFGYVVD